MSSKKVTIKEVAARAGVAISTVSLVLNNQDPVREETRRAVKKAVRELGYVKNSLAASMKSGHSKMIAVVVPDFINSFFTDVIQGIEEVVASGGYFTLVVTTGESQEKEKRLFAGEIGKMVEGAILIPTIEDAQYYESLAKPVVMIDRTVGGLSAVVVDNYKGAHMATNELIANGHEKIAIINGDRDFEISSGRKRGYADAMREHGLQILPEYDCAGPWYQESGFQMTERLLSLPNPPTAILAANSQICIGCINYMRDKNIRIGRDISLISFDDTLLAQVVRPGVTVVERPTVEMGRIGARMLLDSLEGQKPQYQRLVLDVRLIRRGSIAKLNK